MNILIATNTRYMLPTSVLLYSLCKQHANQEIDLYVAYHNLTEADFKRMEQILSLYPNKRLHRLDVGDEFSKQVKADARFSHESYYRILALELLPASVDRILYLDADMLVKGDLSNVYMSSFPRNCPFKVCHDICGYRDNGFEAIKRRAQVPSEYKYFNSGFMLINMEYIRRQRSVGYIVDAFCREYSFYRLHDQDILNHMYYDKVEFVPWALYNIVPGLWYLDTQDFSNEEIRFAQYAEIHNGSVRGNSRFIDMTKQMRDNAKIIHFCWVMKPWEFTRETVYRDIVLFSDLWYDAEEEMYARLPSLKRLTFKDDMN